MDKEFSLDCSPHGVSGGPSTCSPASSQQNPLTIGRGMREKPKGSWSLVIKEEEGEDKGEGEEERKKTRILAFGQQEMSQG